MSPPADQQDPPFVCFLDEFGYYAQPGFGALFEAARSGPSADALRVMAQTARAQEEAAALAEHLDSAGSAPPKRL